MKLKPEFDDIEVLKAIGNGAGSIIYRVSSRETNREFAVKHVTRTSIEEIERGRQKLPGNEPLKLDKEFYQSFFNQVQNEFTILKEFQDTGGSPNVVYAEDLRPVRSGLRHHGYSLLLDFIEGEGLRDNRNYPMKKLVEFCHQAAQGLMELHLTGVIHADLKPQHLMVTPAGLVKLIDFGQSCRVGQSKQKIEGTPDYMAPEQLQGQVIDARTDIYGMGATMYWVFTGRHNRPALTGTGAEFMVSYTNRSSSVRQDNPDVPKELDKLIIACCEPKPENRPQTMKSVWQDLAKILKVADFPDEA